MAIRLVLVEDDKFISRAYTDALTRAEFEVHPVTDGMEAVQTIKDVMPDMVLLDLILPGKDGFEILADLKIDEQLANIPVIVMSNLGQDSDIDKAKQLGAVEYLIKSNVSVHEVVEKLKVTLATLKQQG